MSLSNLFIPNDLDLNCHQLTVSDLLTANSFDVANITTSNIITTNLSAVDASISDNLILSGLTENNALVELLVRDPGDNTIHWRILVPGMGDVDGPASSTDDAIARFDGITGKLIQNSTV